MDRNRQDYENAEITRVNTTTHHTWQGSGVRYPSNRRAPFVNERVSEESSASKRANRSRRKLIRGLIAAAVILVTLGVIGAIVSTTLAKSDKEKDSNTVERVVKKGYEGQLTWTSKTWTDSLNDKNSSEYKTTEAEFIQKVDAKFSQGDLAEKYGYTIVIGFKKGSVQVSFVIVLQAMMKVEIGNDDIPSITTADGLINAGVNIGVEINTVMDVFADDPEFDDLVVSDMNECDSNPCSNGGTCTNDVGQFICTCLPGYKGETCNEDIDDIDDCDSDPCGNALACIDAVNDYTCLCETGWTGKDCNMNIDECASNPCRNGGSCKDGINSYTCTCQIGYTDTNCQTDINDCDSDPCKNSLACIDAVNDYMCICEAGWTGKNCSINTNDCESEPCKNEGVCIDQVNDYKCTCQSGWEGKDCDLNVDDCINDNCDHGVCSDGVNAYACNCDHGWEGQYCDQDVNECLDDPCENSFGCQNIIGSFLCICNSGWAGSACDQNINECDLAVILCKNGATCVDSVGSYTCVCVEGWEGKHCEIAITATTKTLAISETTSTTPKGTSKGTTKSPCDTASEYECITGNVSCISSKKLCDGQTDCDDNSDELLCPSKSTQAGTSTTASTSTRNTTTTTNTTRKTTKSATSATSTTPPTSTTSPSSTATTTTPFTCDADEVLCDIDTQCIPDSYLCDGDLDCSDGSDEEDCPNPCRDDQLYCDGRCYPGYWICDSYVDCYDGSDEKGCADCPEGRCKNGDCYKFVSACNGLKDCTDGTDEKDCPLVCLEDQFKCISLLHEKCVNVSQLCDGSRDCPDGSDEWYNCSETTTATNPLEFEVRLMDGDNDTTELLYGRVEIRPLVNGEPLGEFGTICDDSWDSREAAVLCKSLNASESGPSYAYGSAAFGKGSGPIWFRNFHCEGDEDRLEDCISSEFVHCSHQQDAAISCGVDRTTSTLSTSTTQTPVMSSTTTSPTKTTIAPTEGDPNIRLVGGDNCLEGRVEFFYDNEWATVCDAYFYSYEANAVCKSLGFSTYDSYRLYFGPGTGAYYYLYCSYGDESIWDCDIGLGYCSHTEDVSIRCAGDPDVLCKINPGVPSVNCTFNQDICAYNRTKISGKVYWNWKEGSSVFMTDADNIVNGKIMLYENIEGSETDGARIESPVFSPSAGSMKVEFYYQLHQSSFKNLILSLGETMDGVGYEMEELWSSGYLPRDLEYKWLYQCLSLTDLNLSSNYSLMFTAMRGPNAKTVTAVDGIHVSDGHCPESLLDGMCTFDQLSVCGLTVECSTCERTMWNYKWIWMNSTQHGHYMLADSSFGSEGDESVMSFSVPNLGAKTVLYFWYYMTGENRGKLEVHLYEGGTFHSNLVGLSGDNGSTIWRFQCLMLPSDIDRTAEIKIKFKAVNGKSGTADIGVDGVTLDSGECSQLIESYVPNIVNVVSCIEDKPQCGWTTSANSLLSWTFNEEYAGSIYTEIIRLVNGHGSNSGFVEIFHDGEWGRVCDNGFGTNDAKVVCRMLGYPTDYVYYYAYRNNERGLRVWLDNLRCTGVEETLEDCQYSGWGIEDCAYYEHIFVNCYGEASVRFLGFEKNFFSLHDADAALGSWALVSSRAFEHQAGNYRFLFEYLKSEGVILQIWYHSFKENQTHIVDKIIDETDLEQFCVDLPQDLNGKISLGITAFRMSNGTVKSAVKDFELVQGTCRESLATVTYTFEKKYRMTGYDVIPFPVEGSCESWHGWTRVLASTNKHMDKDHTLQDETGHYMYVDGRSIYSALQLATVSEEESNKFCSLQLYYFTSGEPHSGGLFVNVNDIQQVLTGIPKVNAWFQSCVTLDDTCGNRTGQINITFEAFGMMAGIDDILLSTEPCKEIEAASISCMFWEGHTCGYYMDSWAWNRSSDGPLITAAYTSGRFLVSPPFDVVTNSCISITFNGSSEYAVEMTVIDNTGETVAASGLKKVKNPKDKEMYLNVKPGTGLRLYFDAYSTNYSYLVRNELAVYFVNISVPSCKCSGLSCAEDDDTSDGKYESSVNCTFNTTNSACGYHLFNARMSNAAGGRVEMYAELAYIVSPEVSVSTNSCLVIYLGPCSPSNIRISTDDGEMYTVLYHTLTWNGFQTVNVDVIAGSYKGLLIETQSYVPFLYSRSTIANITLLDQPCESQMTKTTSFTTASSQTAGTSSSQTAGTSSSQTASSTRNSKTTSSPVQLPDNFPMVEVEEVGILEYGDSVTLSCRVTYTTDFEVIMHWRKGSNFTISRADDVLSRDWPKTKYLVTMSQDIDETVYNLTINDISEDDIDYFSCVVDVLGYTAEYWPSDKTKILIKEDGCFGIHNTEIGKFCPSFGYKRVTVPTLSGLQTLNQVNQAVLSLQSSFDDEQIFLDVDKGCLSGLKSLACGLVVNHCKAGKIVRPVCREHCQDIVSLCGDKLSLSILTAGYVCKYLPSIEDDPDCQALWLECGTSIKLGNHNGINGSAVRLRSENYPNGSPSSPRCNYVVYVSRYYTVNVAVSDIMLADDCLNSYLQINGEKICSDNTSKLEQLVDGEVVRITLFANASETATGFLMTFSQALPTGMCDIIWIKDFHHQQYDGYITKTPSCSEWLFYTLVYQIELKFTSLDGCVKIHDEDSKYIQEICDVQTKPEFSLYDAIKIHSSDGFRLTYMLVPYRVQDFTIESIELRGGASDNEGKVFITRSDGIRGYICGYISSEAADVICRAAGFAYAESVKYFSEEINKEDVILYDFDCHGYEDSLMQCYNQEWKDTCTRYCSCYYTPLGVSCALKSLTCYRFSNETGSCGYTFDSSKVLPVFTLRFGDGLYTTGSERHITNISSPEFTYLRGDSISFGYSFDGNPNDSLELYLKTVDGSAITSLWQKPEFTLDGRFTACVQLLDNNIQKPVQLVFKMTLMPSVADKDHSIGLHFVEQKHKSCQDIFPKGVCAFDNVDDCSEMFSQICYVNSAETSIWKIKNNMLIGDTSYASPDKEYPISFSALKTAGSYLHFKYSQTGSGVGGNDLKLQVRSESNADGLQTFYSISENKLEFINICTRLPSTEDDSFNISFILTKSSSEGSIFLDDISVSDVSCPNPISCDFEIDNCAFVNTSNAGFYWKRIIETYTAGDFRDGYVMQALHNGRDIEQRAEFQTPVAYLSGDALYRCLSFLYKTNFWTDAYYKLEVEVLYLDTNEKVTREVPVFIPYMWQEENIEVDPSKSTKAQFSFLLTRFSGQVYMPVAVDDVTLLQSNCIAGLQDMKECNFSNPGFCSFERNFTTGSAYMWKVQSGYTSTSTTGPSADADGNTKGHYLYMDSSLGATGHESYLWFKVDLTKSTSHQYQFFYHVSGDGTAKLETFYRDATTNTYSQKSTIGYVASDMWQLSNCYQLPSNFRGEIYFKAVRGDSVFSDIALDNVRVMDGSCKGPSVSCDFSSSSCGYIPNKGEWTLKGGYITAVGTGELDVPIYTLTEESCIRFEFEGYVNDVLTLRIDRGFEHEEKRYFVYTDGINLGQISYHPTDKRMNFLNTISTVVMIGRVEVASGGCKELTCSTNEMACSIQCIPMSLLCDGTLNCADGMDERDCGFNIACEFSESMCGYETVSRSPTNWTVSDSHSFNYKDIERTVSGGMLLTSYNDVSSTEKTSVSSKWQTITEKSCLRFSYLGTVPSLTVTVSNKDNGTYVQWIDSYADMTPTSWRPAQMTVEAGTIIVTFTTSKIGTNYTVNTPSDAFVAINKIEILSAACDMLDPPDCPDDAGSQCDNGSLCYNEEVKCDRKQYCLSGLDESPKVCNTVFIIPCDFEQLNMCGWTIQTISGTPWTLSTGYRDQIPPYDHTKSDVTGHFLHSVSEEGENFHYERSLVTSPSQIFKEDGCITFWYYLNSTATQPSALSAQILVSLFYMDSNRREFLWYDYVDRSIDTWMQGGVPVHANRSVQMHVTSIHFETYSAWPGVVALDDVEYTAGKCLPKQECHMRSFECKDSGACIPEEFICDGKVDCEDKSDEAMCKDRPDGTLSLAGGDGSYGQLRYYQHSSWYAVCHSGSAEKAFYMAHWACKQLGYGGNADVFEYHYVDNDMQAVLFECNLTSCEVSSCYTYYSTTFAGIMCSNSACFSGQKRCRGTDSVVCLAKERFCDGLPDCPDNSDEEECYCKAGENHCTKTFDDCTGDICQTCADKDMFECQNHQCIDKTRRCDGKKDCSDGLDEYRCVQVNANQVLVHNGSELLNVCYNNIGLDEADILCSLSGKGMVTTQGIGHGHTPISDGVILSETDDAGTLLPGLHISQKMECYPLVLECELPECGTTIYMDRAISPLIVHGDKAVPGEWPHQGYLTVSDYLECGCTLLGERWVLTAAHCVDYISSTSSISVSFGSSFVGDKSPYVQEINVTAIRMHPSYDEDYIAKGNDLAVLQLAYAPNINANTRPVCLGREESWKEILDLGEEAECYITGFGKTEVFLATGEYDDHQYLRKTRVRIVDRNTCQQRYDKIDVTIAVDDICVDNRKPYAPACSGDSGGPLVCKNKAGRWEQFGVTSYGSRYCKSLVPNVYVSVMSNVEWIKSITGLNFENTEENVP